MHGKDERMRNLDEMLAGIKTIKYNSLEQFFYERIRKTRSFETNRLMKEQILKIIMNFIGSSLIYIALFTATYASGLSDVKIFLIFI